MWPHRFRDTLAVDMLARGATPYDVAKLLGDTIATVEKHYAPFVKELRERTRRLMENGEGLEKTSGTFWHSPRAGRDECNENKILYGGRACKPDSVRCMVRVTNRAPRRSFL